MLRKVFVGQPSRKAPAQFPHRPCVISNYPVHDDRVGLGEVESCFGGVGVPNITRSEAFPSISQHFPVCRPNGPNLIGIESSTKKRHRLSARIGECRPRECRPRVRMTAAKPCSATGIAFSAPVRICKNDSHASLRSGFLDGVANLLHFPIILMRLVFR